MIRFACPTCHKVLKAPDDGAGHKTTCPRCGQRLLVPAPLTVQKKTVLGQLTPAPTSPSVPPAVPAPAAPADADSLALLGLVKDADPTRGGPAQPAYRPRRSWAGTALAVLALAAGAAAMPVAVVQDRLLGVGLAGLGVFLGVVGMFAAVLRRRGAGFGLSLLATGVCGSVLFAAVVLFGKGVIPNGRRAQAQADTGKQDQGAGGGTAKPESQGGPDGRGSNKPGASKPALPRLQGNEKQLVGDYLLQNLDDASSLDIVEWEEPMLVLLGQESAFMEELRQVAGQVSPPARWPRQIRAGNHHGPEIPGQEPRRGQGAHENPVPDPER